MSDSKKKTMRAPTVANGGATWIFVPFQTAETQAQAQEDKKMTKRQRRLMREYSDCREASENQTIPAYLRNASAHRARDIADTLLKSGIDPRKK